MEKAKKILLVDDEVEMVNSLAAILQRKNYETLVATNGSEALELATKHKPDLIILDFLMPGLSGGEVANQLAQDTATADIPVIFLSALNTKEDEEIIRKKSNTCHILAKPIAPEELLAAVSQTLK